MFSTNYEIGVDNLDKNRIVTDKEIFRILENAFAKHSNSLKVGLEDIIKMGYTIVLLSWKLEINNRPKYKDKIKVNTWVKETSKMYFYRDFEIIINDDVAVKATSKWMLLDIKTFKPVMNLELIKKQNPIDKDVFNIKEIKRLKELDNYSKRLDYYIRKSDIDLNNHVHNLNYLDMALEVIDDKYYSNIEIEYLKEIKYDDKIIVMSEKTNDKYYIKIYNETNNVTSALIEIY